VAEQQLNINIGADTRSLEQGLQRATAEVQAFDKSVKKTTDVSGKASTALTNLARVASDAPFGFIAISNNLDPLLQSLSSFGKSSDDAKTKSKALLAALTGGAGLALGFSIITGAVTFLSQKYGGLGNAISALLGKQTALDREIIAASNSYQKFNEKLQTSVQIARESAGSVAGEAARVQALSRIAGDQTITYDKRNAALKELATINKGYFGELKIEDGLVKGLTTSVQLYTQSIIDSAKAKGFEAKIAELAPQLEEQQDLLDKLKKARDKVNETPVQTLTGFNKPIFTQTQIATAAVVKQEEVVNKLKTRSAELESALSKLVGAQVASRIATEASLKAQRDKEEQDRKEAASAANLTAEIKKQAEARAKSLAEILARGSKVQTLDFTSFFDLDQAAAKKRLENLGLLKPVRDAFAEALEPSQGKLGRDFTIIPPAAIQTAIDDVNKLRDAGLAAGAAFSSVISPAIDSVFAALESGENVIQSLGQAFKKLVVDLIKATIKAAGLALVISAASGGKISFGTAFRGSLGLTGGGNGLGGLRGAAAPSFGGVSGFGGGLQLAGQVVFTQRGTDLVGVLNSSNARINRVG
jgi:hypothetical protein